MHRRQHRSPPNIVCASFIANLRAIPACPRCLAGSVSPDCKRTSPCKQHDYRAIARRGQGHVQVRTNLYLRLWKFCREERPDFFRRFRRTCSSKTCANRSDRRICRQPSLRNSLLRCIANRRKRRPKSHAQRIGWPSLRARENRTGPIHQDAVGFRPAAIESISHTYISHTYIAHTYIKNKRHTFYHTVESSTLVLHVFIPHVP